MFRQATYVQLRNKNLIEIHVKTVNKLSFDARDYLGNVRNLLMNVAECIIDEVVTMAPVKYEISWKCYSRWETTLHMKAPTHHFTYESHIIRPANATIDYKIVLKPNVGVPSVQPREEWNAILSFFDTISVEKFDEEALGKDAIAKYRQRHNIH